MEKCCHAWNAFRLIKTTVTEKPCRRARAYIIHTPLQPNSCSMMRGLDIMPQKRASTWESRSENGVLTLVHMRSVEVRSSHKFAPIADGIKFHATGKTAPLNICDLTARLHDLAFRPSSTVNMWPLLSESSTPKGNPPELHVRTNGKANKLVLSSGYWHKDCQKTSL